MSRQKFARVCVAGALALTLAGCAGTQQAEDEDAQPAAQEAAAAAEDDDRSPGQRQLDEALATARGSKTTEADSASTAAATTGEPGSFTVSDQFSDRDLEQEADLSSATRLAVQSGEDTVIADEGVYVLSGTATDATVRVEADKSAKVQLVLDGLSITNASAPAIYVASADKVFVTTAAGSSNALSVTGAFAADGDVSTDAVIFSKDDLVLNGMGALAITSTENGVSSKDDLKVTGGTYTVECAADAFEAHDSIRVADGTFNVTTSKDAFHAEYDEDDTVGYVYIADGTFDLTVGSDGVQGTTVAQIDGGTFDIATQGEGIEATYVVVNGGAIRISAADDGINASQKSSAYTPTIEINGGDITIDMGAGDTDALDSNGYLYINGGTVSLNATSPFDYEWDGAINGGTVYVNGEQVTEIYNSMMGGGMGGFGGGRGGMGGPAPDGEGFGGGRGGMGGQMPDGEGFGGRGGQAPDGEGFGGGRGGRGF